MDNRIKLAVYKSLEWEKQRSAKMDLLLVTNKIHRCKTRFVHEPCLNNLIIDIEQSSYFLQTQIATLLLDILSKYHIEAIPLRWWFTERDILLGYSTFSTKHDEEITHVLFLRDHKVNNMNIKMGEIKEFNPITNIILDELDKQAKSLKRSELYKYLRQWYEKDL